MTQEYSQHDQYVLFVQRGMPEGLDWREQLFWLHGHFRDHDRMRGELAKAERIVDAINFLRDNEGAEVMVCCDNPDFDGPGSLIEVTDDWTEWLPKRFTGDDLGCALRAAELAKEQATGKPRQ